MNFSRRALPLLLLVATRINETTAFAQPVPPPSGALAPAQNLDSYVVTAARTPQSPDQVAFSVTSLDAEFLRGTPAVTLDGALRSVPGFSLFRRSDSLTANPTAQGVSFRGLGPSGASRSLIVLDGVPLNDPFGGWVAWTKVPREGLARAELVPGGGATAWGNAALGGVAQLFTVPADNARDGREPASKASLAATFWRGNHGRAAATIGDYGTRSFEFVTTQAVGNDSLQLLGRAFGTDGFALVAPERRGAIDVAAWSRHRWLTLRWHHPIGQSLALTATARGSEEFRGNGTPYQRNGSREKFGSIALAGQPGEHFAWNAVAYAQDQSFASTFSGVNATRTAETPASDQFAVPATAFGAAWTGVWTQRDGGRTSVGGDARTVRGETREHFTFVAGNFTRLRVAGGRQTVGGVFALHEQPVTRDVHVTAGLRLDAWKDADGHRRESDRATGAIFRDDRYADRDGTELSPSAGLVWHPAKTTRVHGAAQQAFRRPTLNELYRPFRQGANVTEANSALRTERVTSAEFGAEWSPFAAAIAPAHAPRGVTPADRSGPLTLGATVFWNDLHDAVGNVTIARGPGTFPIVGTLAAGGLGRQRLNLDRTRTQGLELAATWRAHADFSVNAAALFNDATVRRAAIAPGLIGKRVAQVPRRSATVAALWRAPAGLTVTPRVRWLGQQFEDDENQLRLGEVVIADLSVSYALSRHLDLWISAENLGNARIETGRSADGIVNTGTPRLVTGGLRGTW